MSRNGALALVAIACLSGFHAFAEKPPAAFEAANRLYMEEKYSEAATTYGILEQSGQKSAALYFNWGNALFKSQQLGKAIAAYREAEELAPRDPDIRANLEFARKQRQGPSLSPNKSQQWLRRLTLNEWAVLMAAALWIFFGALALLQWRPALIRSARGVLIVLGVGTLILCGCAAAAFLNQRSDRLAIVVTTDAVAHNGPLDQSPNAFTLHDGAELAVLDRKDEWLQVEVDAGRSGWIRKDQVILLD
jgi:tetratricopeptide (TPR) repeat protein